MLNVNCHYKCGSAWTYTWEHGKQLASMTGNGTTWTFDYDADGMRTKRASGLNAYNYVYNGGKLTRMTVDGDTLTFTYDAQGNPQTVNYNGTLYYYVTNLQGDVVSILDANGTAVVSYTYDAWGNPLSTTGTMSTTIGTRNPLRYRGYVYDHETGLYYLQSRYYNPKTGRFINADIFTSTGQGQLGNNMFAYCNNNSVMNVDPKGTIPFSDGFFDEAFQELGRLLYELLFGESHPDRQYEEHNPRIIQKQFDDFCWIIESDDFAGVRATARIAVGVRSVGKGFTLIIAPFPTELEEIWGGYKIVKGAFNIIRGIGEWIIEVA